MFTTYFDRSGGVEHQRVIVAGWLATAGKWLEFEPRWREALSSAGVPYFRMTEFANSVGAFEGWRDKEDKRRELLQVLIKIIGETATFGTAVIVPRSVFRAVNVEYNLTSVFKNEFVFAARECADYMNDELLRYGYQPDRWRRVVRYIFDQGEDGEGAVRDLFAADGLSVPSFEFNRDDPVTGDPGVIQLQTADFAAYEYYKLYNLFDGLAGLPYPEPRTSWVLLTKAVSEHLYHEYNEFMISQVCERRGIKRRR